MKETFNGVMRGYNLQTITEKTFNLLIEKGVIHLHAENYENIVGFNDTDWIQGHMFFKGNVYKINSKLIDEICFDLETQIIKQDKSLVFLESLEVTLNKFLIKEEKIKFLNRTYKKQFKTFEETYKDEEQFDFDGTILLDDLSVEEPVLSKQKWKNYISNQVYCSSATLEHHLVSGCYNNDSLDLLKEILEESEWNFIQYWEDWYYLFQIKKYCESKINELQRPHTNPKTTKNSRLTPHEQLAYIDLLRNNYPNFEKESVETKLKCLKIITGNRIENEIEQLIALERIIKMNSDVFYETSDKYLAQEIHAVSKSSVDNLRHAISNFKLKAIQKENIKTDKDKKYKEKFDKAQEKIARAFNKVSTLI